MKWLTPKPGDVRDRVVFAWRATECSDGFTRRFCYLSVREVYTQSYSVLLWNSGAEPYWRVTRVMPVKADPEAETEAAAAELIRQANRPPAPKYRFTLPYPEVIEGDEWKQDDDS